MQYQEANGLFVDGIVGRETRDRARHLARRGVARRPHATAAAGCRRLDRLSAVDGGDHGQPTHHHCRRTRVAASASSTTVPDSVSGPVDDDGRHPLVARVGQQVQQRDAGHARGVQPVRRVDGMERQGLPAEDDPLPRRPTSATSGSTASRSTSRTARRTRPRGARAHDCRVAASARRTMTPTSCGTSPTSAPPSSSPDRPSPDLTSTHRSRSDDRRPLQSRYRSPEPRRAQRSAPHFGVLPERTEIGATRDREIGSEFRGGWISGLTWRRGLRAGSEAGVEAGGVLGGLALGPRRGRCGWRGRRARQARRRCPRRSLAPSGV